MTPTRRAVLKSAAWSLPVIAAAVAVPLAAASTELHRIPLTCTQLNKGGTAWWHVTYNDGSTDTLSNGEMRRDKELRALCR